MKKNFTTNFSKVSLSLVLVLAFSACAKKKETVTIIEREKNLGSIADQIAKEKNPVIKAKKESLLLEKLRQGSLFRTNEGLIKSLDGHTKLYQFNGRYKIMVIPVQFKDAQMVDADFFEHKAQDYIFGDNANSMTTYYKHASLGQFQLEGEVTPIVTVDKDLAFYGEAVSGSSDRNARALVVEALEKLKEIKTDKKWWLSFDNWDINDYDSDKNFHEPDGFVDAVVLIYAGKSQASCQRSFDPKGTRPSSAEVPAGPRHDAAVECFNRLWPHRWAISLSEDDPRYTSKGPVIEGQQRHSLNGLKINDELFALDYNMQSEFSDLSTFMHEFGHSLTLPDIYSNGEGNSTGGWELMSQNASLQAQEFSSYSKLSLGWLSPKVIKQGETTSAYIGNYNYVTETQRLDLGSYDGPLADQDGVSILSNVPEYGEEVYRSLVVLTDPSKEERVVVEYPEHVGHKAAYSGKFDGNSKAISLKLKVPSDGDATLSFDTIYHIETETNFDSSEEEIKVVTDFDIGRVMVNDEILESLRLVSGDQNYDSLAEANPKCEALEVLRLRSKKIQGGLSAEEKTVFDEKTALCQKPIWVKKSYDLSKFKGQEVDFQIVYTTDAGYTEFGIVVDNIKLGDQLINFEDAPNIAGGFTILDDGKEILNFNQFYLMEYRTPGESYKIGDHELSFNMDNNIEEGVQSFFLEKDTSLVDRFRMVQFQYRPGLLVWYFNSKYDRRSNDATAQEGKGYLLVLNSKVQEVKLPGLMSEERFFDENGHYLDEDEDPTFKSFLKGQRDLFACYAYTDYSTYINGERPEGCQDELRDHLQNVTFEGKKLRYRRERFNEFLPYARYATVPVDQTYRNYAGMRTGLSTFNPKEAGDFAPFKVFKEVDGQMVLDQELTQSAQKFEAVSEFKDSENHLAATKRFQGDSVVVEKTGLNFKVVSPSSRVIDQYSQEVSADDNAHWFRRPRVKVYFSWSN